MAQQEQKTAINPEEIIHLVLKRRWFIIVPFCLAVIVGCYLAITLPKVYEASTTIMVQAQRVPDNYVQSVVSSDISSRLNTIMQQVMSRTNIERIIDEYRLYAGPDYEEMFMEDKVAGVRENIEINVNQSRSSTELSTFSISYMGKEPQKVKEIANALASYFIDENLKVREAQAIGTSDFLDDELESMKLRLEKSEQAYGEYRQKYMGGLPEQLEANLSVLERLSAELMDQQQALREANNALALLEQQVAEYRQSALALSDAEGDGETSDLEQLNAQLEALRARYTENHPSVVRLKTMIAKVEESMEMQPDNAVGDGSGESVSGGRRSSAQENQLATLRLQIRNTETEISNLKAQIAVYQKRVEDTPKREEELFSIQRDYENLKAIYDSLLSRRLEAEISVNMEKKQKGEQFQIIDVARLPEKPISPSMKKLFVFTIFAGFGIGGGLIFLLEFMKKSFKSIEDVESTLSLPVLITVPAVLHPRAKAAKRLNNIFSIAGVVVSGLLFVVFAVLILKGVEPTLEFVQRFV